MGENGARVGWSGAGLSLPRRLVSPHGVRLAAARVLADRRYRERADVLARWAEQNDGAKRAAALVEGTCRNPTSRQLPARR
jgi:UDP:flavonoid glycosyltransferase YjiC (YdhE family)